PTELIVRARNPTHSRAPGQRRHGPRPPWSLVDGVLAAQESPHPEYRIVRRGPGTLRPGVPATPAGSRHLGPDPGGVVSPRYGASRRRIPAAWLPAQNTRPQARHSQNSRWVAKVYGGTRARTVSRGAAASAPLHSRQRDSGTRRSRPQAAATSASCASTDSARMSRPASRARVASAASRV